MYGDMALQNGPSSGPVLTAHAFNCDVVTSARLGGKGPVSKGLILQTNIIYCNEFLLQMCMVSLT